MTKGTTSWQICIFLLCLFIGRLWNNRTALMRNDIKLFARYCKCPLHLDYYFRVQEGKKSKGKDFLA